MKKTLIAAGLLLALSAQAQTTIDSSAASTSGSNSASEANAVGNVNSSQSASGSQSGASSGSTSGALGNNLTLIQTSAETQKVEQNYEGTVNSNSNETYNGRIENVQSGGTTSVVRYSGSQTIRNVPSIAMSGPASGPCTGVSGGIGVAGPGFGVGVNGSSVMDDCRLRENTRVMGMAMQSLDGTANPQEKAEATVLFMDALRGLAAYNKQILNSVVKGEPK